MIRTNHALEVTVSFDGAVLAVHHLDGTQRTHFAIGAEAGCDEIVPALDRHSLAMWDGLNAQVTAPPGARLFVEEGAQLRELDRAAHSTVAVARDTRVIVELGAQLFAFRIVERAVVCPPGSRLDWRAEVPTAVTGLVALLLLGIAFAMPPEPRTLAIDLDTVQRAATFEIKPPQDEEKPQPSNSGKPGGAARAAGVNGRAGVKTAKLKTWSPPARHGAKDGELEAAAHEAARDVGVLGVLKVLEGSSTGAVFKPSSVLGDPAQQVMNGLVGTDQPAGYGDGGMGDAGRGPGGGGHDQTIGLARIPTSGRFGPGGPGGDGPGIKAKLRDHKVGDVVPEFIPGDIKGGLDKEIIRRVIRQHKNEVSFCYEKQLLSDNKLAGRLKVRFTINGQGQVLASVTEQSLGNIAVDQCVNEAVRRWEFPKPSTNLVSVGYSFFFKNAGSN